MRPSAARNIDGLKTKRQRRVALIIRMCEPISPHLSCMNGAEFKKELSSNETIGASVAVRSRYNAVIFGGLFTAFHVLPPYLETAPEPSVTVASQMPHTRRVPSAFSLVELLVVIAILVLIVALMLPAITKSIEGADRNQCAAKAAKLATAMGSYDTRHNVFPGIRNSLAIKSPDGNAPNTKLYHWKGGPFIKPADFSLPNSSVSWFIMILPHVGFTSHFNDCVDGTLWLGSHARISNDMTHCPSRADHYNLANGDVNMHYRANGAGASTSPGSFNRNDGAIGDNANNVFVSLADVVAGDGASTTMLIGEGKRDRWAPHTWSADNNMAGKTSYGTFQTVGGNNYKYHVHPDPGGNLLFGFTTSGTVNATTPIVNTQQVLFPTSAEQSFGNVSEAVHPGGSNVAFVDGSWRFLSDTLSPHVYGHLLTHRSVWDGANYSTNSARANVFLKCPPAPMPYSLKPEDY